MMRIIEGIRGNRGRKMTKENNLTQFDGEYVEMNEVVWEIYNRGIT